MKSISAIVAQHGYHHQVPQTVFRCGLWSRRPTTGNAEGSREAMQRFSQQTTSRIDCLSIFSPPTKGGIPTGILGIRAVCAL